MKTAKCKATVSVNKTILEKEKSGGERQVSLGSKSPLGETLRTRKGGKNGGDLEDLSLRKQGGERTRSLTPVAS